LSFVVAFAIDSVADVSRRYQKMDDEMLERRRAIVRDDEFVSKAIARCSETLQTNLDAARRELLRKRNEEERELLLDVSREEEKRNLPGRTTGSLEWRKARGELGENNNNSRKNLS
jgi:peptide-N4-(N-acetyl-beta-glucosaminyl)asparagine amidase